MGRNILAIKDSATGDWLRGASGMQLVFYSDAEAQKYINNFSGKISRLSIELVRQSRETEESPHTTEYGIR